MQLELVPSVVPEQVPDFVYPGGAPGYDIPFAVAVPLLETVMVFGADVAPTFTLPNVRLAGVTDTFGAVAAAPDPERGMGTFVPPLPVTVTVVLALPAAVGENVNVSVQVAPAASVAPQFVAVRANGADTLP